MYDPLEKPVLHTNFEDYKKWSIFNEGTLILKIKWDV